MSRVFLGLLVSTLLPKFEAQQDSAFDHLPHPFHGNSNSNKILNTKHQILGKFDKPSSVRLKRYGPRDSFSTSIYKCHPVKGTCDLNVYNIFSNDPLSGRLRSDYEIWNFSDFHAPHSETRIQRFSNRNPVISKGDQEIVARSKARYTKLVDSPENKPYVLDDDYSLVNYVDNWKGLDPDHKIRRCHGKSELKAKIRHPKRDLDDKEFQVEFHSSKDTEFRGKLPSSSELVKERKRKSSINRRVKSHYRSKYDRNYGYFDPGAIHLKTKYNACKRKHVSWGRKRAKVYPKLGPRSGFLDELETRSRSNMAMGHVWHWATTRNYVMAALTPRKEFVTPHNLDMGMMPKVFVPAMNLSESLVRKSFAANVNQPQWQPVGFRQAAFPQRLIPQHIPSANLQIGLPSNREVELALKQVFNQKQGPINMGNPTRHPSVYFNRPTEYINPYENHYEKFKNTPFWNARQGPPGLRGVLASPVRLSNFQRFKITPKTMKNEKYVNPSLSLSSLFENIREDAGSAKLKNGSDVIQKFKVLPVKKQDVIPLNQTPKVLETADIVNLLQSALLPRNGTDPHAATTTEETLALFPKNIPIDKVLDMIAPSRSTSNSISKPLAQATENAVHPVTEDPKLIVDSTKEALLSLFTTRGPIIESLEDILRRNTDRKIPIVYDIEDAPQLSAKKSSSNTENPATNPNSLGSETEETSHVLVRRGILKKNKTSVKHKTVQKNNSVNTTLTTPWIVLATTENMLYSELMEMEREKLNASRKSKTRKATSRSKITLFKNKSKPSDTTDEPPKSTNEPKVKSKRDQKAVANSRPGKSHYEPVTSEPRCGQCTCCCHPTPPPTKCCSCREPPPLELTTKVSCGPASLSIGCISCPDCHQEFTYKLGLKPLIIL